MQKLQPSAAAAIADIPDGATLAIGGFGLCGNPENLIAALAAKGVKGLTIVSNNCGTTDDGLGVLLRARQVRKKVSSYVGENKEFERQYLSGELEVELVPQGTLAERCRAAAAGIAGFYTPAGKEQRDFDGRTYVLERARAADVALVRTAKTDRCGNSRFWRTARNFNPVMASAAKLSIAECDKLVDNGAIDPDDVHLAGIFVHRIIHVPEHENAFEYKTTRKRPS